MKTYFRINIIEFFMIVILIYCWIIGVNHVIGIAVLYIIVATREKLVMYNRLEEKEGSTSIRNQIKNFNENGKYFQTLLFPDPEFYYTDELYKYAVKRHEDGMSVKMVKRYESKTVTLNGAIPNDRSVPITFYNKENVVIGKGIVKKHSSHVDRIKESMILQCPGFNKYMLGINQDRGAIKITEEPYEKYADGDGYFIYRGQYWQIIN